MVFKPYINNEILPFFGFTILVKAVDVTCSGIGELTKPKKELI